MSIKYISFTNKVSALVTESSHRRKVVAAVIAQVLAECAPLPSSAVTDLDNYYLMNVRSFIYDLMGPLNEKLNFDLTMAQEFTRQNWKIRYNCLFPIDPVRRKFNSQYGYFDTIMGVGVFVTEEHHQFVNQYKTEILDLYCDLCAIINDKG